MTHEPTRFVFLSELLTKIGLDIFVPDNFNSQLGWLVHGNESLASGESDLCPAYLMSQGKLAAQR